MALTSNKLPPQAYTRDTLVKAIEWLSGQPSAVRERANSADLIVSHYLQARRQSSAISEEIAPVSTESFKADLKHLAQDLKKFEDPSAPPPQLQPITPARAPSYVRDQLETIVNHHRQDSLFRHELTRQDRVAPSGQAPVHTQAPVHAPVPQQAPVHAPVHAPAPMPATQSQITTMTETTTTVKSVAWTVDARSLAVAQELQEALNLSSEGEALRMLVKLGAERVKGLIS